MPTIQVHGGDRLEVISLPDACDVEIVPPYRAPTAADPLGTVARTIDAPLGRPPLSEWARDAQQVAIVVPDGTRPPLARSALLPILSRLARVGLGPERLRVVIGRGIHPAAPRHEIEALLGEEMLRVLRPVQSAPETPGLNAVWCEDPRLGPVRVHRQVASAERVVLVGIVTPHHLAGFGGGPKALVPGVADRDAVLAAHRQTLDSLVRPDGSIRPLTGTVTGNPFQSLLRRIAQAGPPTFSVNLVPDGTGGLAAAAAGDVAQAHDHAIELWQHLGERDPATGDADLVVVGSRPPRSRTLLQAHKALLAAAAHAREGAPLIWLADAVDGAGHEAFLPWFEAGKLPRHLAALRDHFHPYGLTAYSIRRLAAAHPIHIVSRLSKDLTRPMGLHPADSGQEAVERILQDAPATGLRVRVLPDA